MKGFRPEVIAVAVLWVAAKAAGEPRPLDDSSNAVRQTRERLGRRRGGLKK